MIVDMEMMRRLRVWLGPPLAVQIMGLLLGGLVVAQLVTLALTWLLPPAPQRQYELVDIARALSGNDPDGRGASAFERVLRNGPPDPVGPGWLTSERSRAELAQMLGRGGSEGRLFSFPPLPFAGTARPSQRAASGFAPSGRHREPVMAQAIDA